MKVIHFALLRMWWGWEGIIQSKHVSCSTGDSQPSVRMSCCSWSYYDLHILNLYQVHHNNASMCLAGCMLCFELSAEIQPGIELAPISVFLTILYLTVCPPFSILNPISSPNTACRVQIPRATSISLWSTKAFHRDFGKRDQEMAQNHKRSGGKNPRDSSSFERGKNWATLHVKGNTLHFAQWHSPFYGGSDLWLNNYLFKNCSWAEFQPYKSIKIWFDSNYQVIEAQISLP